jgi:Ni/Co efflux regulator RcnB
MLKPIVLATVVLSLGWTAAATARDHQNDQKVVVHDQKTVVHKTVVRPTVVHRTVVRPVAGRGWVDRSDYRQGGRIAQNDWRRGRVVDYRTHHLRAPPAGYEWRQVDGRYVMAAVATGVIASIILSGQ